MKQDISAILGQGYNALTQKLTERSAVKVECNRSLLGKKLTESAAVVCEDDLKGQILLESAPEGIMLLQAFDSLSDLRTLSSTSLTLAAKMQELGFSLDVSASREQTVDVTKLYYLLRITSPEQTRRVAGIPDLTELANRILGLSTPEIKTAVEDIENKKSALINAEAKLAPLKEKREATEKLIAETAQATQIITQDIAAIETISQDQRSQKIKDQLESLRISLATKEENSKLLSETMTITNATIAIQTKNIDDRAESFNKAKDDLTALKKNAIAQIKNKLEILENFYKEFGTDYVNKITEGRELVALITFNRSSITDKESFGIDGKLEAKQVSVGGSHTSETKKSINEAITDISISFTGIKASSFKKPPKTMEDLYQCIEGFYDKDNYLENPGIIDFSTCSYTNVLKAIEIEEASISRITTRITENQKLLNQLLELRTKAVRCYAPHSYHQNTLSLAPQPTGRHLELDEDPHILVLRSLFSRLLADNKKSGIIIELNDYIKNILHDITADYSATINDWNLNNKGLDTIERNLKKRVSYKLLYINQIQLSKFSCPSIKIYALSFPENATHVMLSSTRTDAQQGIGTENAANNTLTWITGMSCRMQLVNPWPMCNQTLFKAHARQQPGRSTDAPFKMIGEITPEMRRPNSKFVLRHFCGEPKNEAVTLRIFAVAPPATLGFGSIDLETKESWAQAIVASKPSQMGLFSKGRISAQVQATAQFKKG